MSNELIGLFDVDWMPTSAWRPSAKDLALSHNLPTKQMNRQFWRGKRVFLTGHTGFKGGWLALWLADMGAEVHGYALTPPTEPNLFAIANIQARLARSTIADIRDAAALAQAMQVAQPDIVLHLAAQPHEASTLKLDSSKAKTQLGWHPRWNLQTALGMTLAWHQAWKQGSDMATISVQQIQEYEAVGQA